MTGLRPANLLAKSNSTYTRVQTRKWGLIASNAEQLAAAIAEAQRHPTVGGFGWAGPPCGFMTNPAELQRYRARKDGVTQHDTIEPPPERPYVPVRDDGGPALVQVAAEAPTAADEPVWQALLDVQVWRSRPWWWRLAASLVVKRLNR
jgi:hypothetical protein